MYRNKHYEKHNHLKNKTNTMKKIFSLIAITAVAATMFTSCKKDTPAVPETGKAKLSITAAPATVAIAAEGTFTVTSNINAPEAIVVTVKSNDDKILTVNPASVTIAQGTKTITGKYTGVANGKATITITTTTANTTISAGSVEITVGTPPPASAEIAKMFTGFHEAEDDKDATYFYGYHEDPTDPAPEGSRVNLAYFRIIDRGTIEGVVEGIVLDVYAWSTKESAMGVGVLKQLDANGQGIFLTAVAEGTAITFDAMVTSPYGYYETLCKPDYKDLATGKDVYIAFACGNGGKEEEGGTSSNLRAWAKINIGTAGGYSDVNLIEAYVCLNDGEFKVGQKE